jgi:hypothetical protein
VIGIPGLFGAPYSNNRGGATLTIKRLK